jgi:hypothetical protein
MQAYVMALDLPFVTFITKAFYRSMIYVFPRQGGVDVPWTDFCTLVSD